MALTAQFSSFQQTLNIFVIRADTFTRKLCQIADEDGTPSDLTGYEFYIQVRKTPRSNNVLVTIDNDDFFLGQSSEAVAYDLTVGNAPGTTRDEVYVNASANLMEIDAGNWYYDLQVVDPGGDIQRPIGGRFSVLQNITQVDP